MRRKDEWPEVDELVIATVEEVIDHGAYVTLDEYDKRGFLHISEVSSSWVRNIRDYVRERQKVVLKVLRINPEIGHVDLSLRRVTKREKIEKMLSWKMERRAESFLRSAAEKLGMNFNDVYEGVGLILEKEYGGIYDGLERVAKDGVELLLRLGINKDIALAIEDVVKEKIKPPTVKVKGVLELRCFKSNGVDVIRNALLSAKKAVKSKTVEVRLYTIAPPRYSVEVIADDYKRAEHVLQKISEAVLENIVKMGGIGSFKREK